MKNVFVGNLSFQMTEGDLRELFEQFGEVARVQILNDRDTGRSRGFGFVEMPNEDEASRAIAGLNGQAVNGRSLTVNEARPRAERAPRSFGGGSGGSGGGGGRGGRGGGRFERDDYRGAARQPREPRW